MRYLVFLLLFSVALVAESESALSVEPMVVFPSSVLVEQQTTESTAHLVVLGALEKVNHELQPEKFILVPGRKEASTWYLPEARRTKQVAEHFKSQLVGSANILFECRGRSCGSSSYWANTHFERAILYGPEQYQHYLIAQRSTSKAPVPAASASEPSIAEPSIAEPSALESLVSEKAIPQQIEAGDYVVIYIGERATRKIYAHIETISLVKPQS